MSKIVYPDYNNSILNTITSILKYYNVESKHSSLNELDKALEICNALVNFKGVTINYAYSLRGILKEVKGDTEEALEDYMMANDMDNYNRLQEEIKAQQLQEQQKKQQQQKKSTKPTLTK